MPKSSILLGIDPGFAIVGWGVIQKQGTRITYIDCGAIHTQPSDAFAERLSLIYQELQSVLTTYKPDSAAIEELFFSTNVKTAIHVAHARGVIVLACRQHQIPLAEYGPRTVKQTITGDGNAEKKQMQNMVKNILKLSAIPKPDDAADAVALALTHAYHHSTLL